MASPRFSAASMAMCKILLEFRLASKLREFGGAQRGFKLPLAFQRRRRTRFRSRACCSRLRTSSSAFGTMARTRAPGSAIFALRTAASAAARWQPRFRSAESTSCSTSLSTGSARAETAGAAPPPKPSNFSFNSNTMRSAVFLPTPGMRTSCATSPPRIASMMAGAASPDSTLMASEGPMPLTEISFSNSVFSSAVKKPNNASASSRTCV